MNEKIFILITLLGLNVYASQNPIESQPTSNYLNSINKKIRNKKIKAIQADKDKILFLTVSGNVYYFDQSEQQQLKKLNISKNVSHILYPLYEIRNDKKEKRNAFAYSVANRLMQDELYLYPFDSQISTKIGTHKSHIFKLGQIGIYYLQKATQNKIHEYRILSNSLFPTLTVINPDYQIIQDHQPFFYDFYKKTRQKISPTHTMEEFKEEETKQNHKPHSFKNTILIGSEDTVAVIAQQDYTFKPRHFSFQSLYKKPYFIEYNFNVTINSIKQDQKSIGQIRLNTKDKTDLNHLNKSGRKNLLNELCKDLTPLQILLLMDKFNPQDQPSPNESGQPNDEITAYLSRLHQEKSQLMRKNKQDPNQANNNDQQIVDETFKKYEEYQKTSHPESGPPAKINPSSDTFYKLWLSSPRHAPITAINTECSYLTIVIKDKNRLLRINSVPDDRKYTEILLAKSFENRPLGMYLVYPFQKNRSFNSASPLWLIFVYKNGIYYCNINHSLYNYEKIETLHSIAYITCSCFDRDTKTLYYIYRNKEQRLQMGTVEIITEYEKNQKKITEQKEVTAQRVKALGNYIQAKKEYGITD